MKLSDKVPGRMIRAATIGTMIPLVLGVGPLVGWYFGGVVGAWAGKADLGRTVGVFMGLAAGARQAWVLTCQVRAELAAESDGEDRGE